MNKQYNKLLIVSAYIKMIYDNLYDFELKNKTKTNKYNYLINEINILSKYESELLDKIYLNDTNFNENMMELKLTYFKNNRNNTYLNQIFDRLENMLNIKIIRNLEKDHSSYKGVFEVLFRKESSALEEEYYVGQYLNNTINRSIESAFIYLLNKRIKSEKNIEIKNLLIKEKYRLSYSNTVLENEFILSNYNVNPNNIFIYSNNINLDSKYDIDDIKSFIVNKRLIQLIELLKESSKYDVSKDKYKLRLYVIEIYIRSLGLIGDIKESLIEKSNSDNLVANSIINAIIKLLDEDKKEITDVPPIYKFPKR